MRAKRVEPPRERGPWPRGQSISFFVGGVEPAPKGNMRAFVPKKWAAAAHAAGQSPRAVVTDAGGSTLRAYESVVRNAARAELDRRGLPCAMKTPFEVIIGYYFARGSGELDGHGRVLGSARATPWVKPDIDKLTRATLDALTLLVWDDDSRIVRLVVEKRFAETDVGTLIKITRRPPTVREAIAERQLTM